MHRDPRLLATVFAALMTLGCETPGEPWSPAPRDITAIHPLSESWDLTTSLDRVVLRTSPTTFDTLPEGRANLTGILILPPFREFNKGDSFRVLGEVHASFCYSIGQDDCELVGPERLDYPFGRWNPGAKSIQLAQTGDYSRYHQITLTPNEITADSLTGELKWTGPASQSAVYLGNFVARRRK